MVRRALLISLLLIMIINVTKAEHISSDSRPMNMLEFLENVLRTADESNYDIRHIMENEFDSFGYLGTGVFDLWSIKDRFALQQLFFDYGIWVAEEMRYVFGLPGEGEITEDDAIEIAKQELILTFHEPETAVKQSRAEVWFFSLYGDFTSIWEITLYHQENPFCFSLTYTVVINAQTGEIYNVYHANDGNPNG